MSRLEDCARTAVGKGPLLVPRVIRWVPFAKGPPAVGCAETAPANQTIPIAAMTALQSCDNPDISSSILASFRNEIIRSSLSPISTLHPGREFLVYIAAM